MSEHKSFDDGGSAFPYTDLQQPIGEPAIAGMSLLDYFAGQALANPAICHSYLVPESVPFVAYQAAIQMLNERERIMQGGK